MSKPQSPSDRARTEKRRNAVPTPPPVQAATAPFFSPQRIMWGLVLAGLAIGGCVAYHHSRKEERTSAELDLCRKFMARQERSRLLRQRLARAGSDGSHRGGPERSGRSAARQFYLRDDYRIESVRPQTEEINGPDALFVLVTSGGVSSPRMAEIGPKGTDIISRTISNPDIVVRVKDGKLIAVAAGTQHDKNEKPMSEENLRKLRRSLGKDR